jgi:hypothetical protein
LNLGELGRGAEQIARALDELVLLRRREMRELERLSGDRRLALPAIHQQTVHLQSENRQRRA